MRYLCTFWILFLPFGTAPLFTAPAPAIKEKKKWTHQIEMNQAIHFLKKQQNKNASWENSVLATSQPGGISCLVTYALLQSGVPQKDDCIQNALPYIRSLEPQHVYVTSLQTCVLCKLQQKQDQNKIEANIEWLLKAAVYDKTGDLMGWSYTSNANMGDNSNSQFAIMALHIAAEFGYTVDPIIWKKIRSFYINTQHKNGAWGYQPKGGYSPSMTTAGLCNLRICDLRLDDTTEDAKSAQDKGFGFWMDKMSFASKQPYQGYQLFHSARMGKLFNKKMIRHPVQDKSIDWYAEGSTIILKSQNDNGAFELQEADNAKLISTAFGLLFLSSELK